MANSLKCDLCSKPATVHLTQIVNSKIHKVDLCEACAADENSLLAIAARRIQYADMNLLMRSAVGPIPNNQRSP